MSEQDTKLIPVIVSWWGYIGPAFGTCIIRPTAPAEGYAHCPYIPEPEDADG